MSLCPRIFIICALLWSGMILGISFLEAPVKFHAPSLTLPIGLDVGRHVFSAFEKCQWLLAGLLTLIVFTGIESGKIKNISLLVVFLQCIQSIWLLPELQDRALTIIANGSVIVSYHHYLFGMVEIIKLLLLLTLAWQALAIFDRGALNAHIT